MIWKFQSNSALEGVLNEFSTVSPVVVVYLNLWLIELMVLMSEIIMVFFRKLESVIMLDIIHSNNSISFTKRKVNH